MVNAPSNQFRRYNRIITGAFPELSRVQNGIADCLDDVVALLQNFTPLNGKLHQEISLDSFSTLNLQHQLGRAYVGMFAVSVLAPEPIRLIAWADGASTDVPGNSTAYLTMLSVLDPYGIIVGSPSENIVFPRTTYISLARSLIAETSGNPHLSANLLADLYDVTLSAPKIPPICSYTTGAVEVLRVVSTSTYKFRVRNTTGTTRQVLGGASTNTILTVMESGEAAPYIDSGSTADPTQFVPIRSDRACTADIWVW